MDYIFEGRYLDVVVLIVISLRAWEKSAHKTRQKAARALVTVRIESV